MSTLDYIILFSGKLALSLILWAAILALVWYIVNRMHRLRLAGLAWKIHSAAIREYRRTHPEAFTAFDKATDKDEDES